MHILYTTVYIIVCRQLQSPRVRLGQIEMSRPNDLIRKKPEISVCQDYTNVPHICPPLS